MDDMAADSAGMELTQSPEQELDTAPDLSERDKNLIARIQRNIRADRMYFTKAFEQMRADMFMASHGRDKKWPETNYTANIVGRHIRTKTAALYAKNPKAVARRRDTLDFTQWDENEQSLMVALQQVQQAAMAQNTMQMQPDPATGQMVPVQAPMPPGFEEAQAVLADFQQGMARRQQIKKFGRTLEILFAHALENQKPLNFKMAMKQLVRRACTTGVGYVEVGWQRETGPRPGMTERLADHQARLAHLENLMNELQEGELEETQAEMAELERMIADLQAQPEIIVREGLIFDFPQSTAVIPDKNTKQLVGFVGAQHLTIQYIYSKDQVEEIFGVDVGDEFTPYTMDGKKRSEDFMPRHIDDELDSYAGNGSADERKDEFVCVWKYYDKPSGLVYYLADGHKKYLRDPESPEVNVSDFWPVYALTFNAVESEDELFPPSDVRLLRDMQQEYNRCRQGKREHRQAARPRWGYSNGALDDEDIEQLKKSDPMDAIGLNIDPSTKVSDVLQEIPVPGVDPNLYDVNEIWSDMQVVAGTQAAVLGGMSKGTATEASISANSSATSDGSSIDDLDAFLSMIARASSQVLMRDMSPEKVTEIVGPGAVWLPLTDQAIIDEVWLEVEAGSTGKPNQAVEINNWQQMLPFLVQMPSIPPTWLARETLRRLDDRMDLSEAIVDGLPSIVAQNSMAQPSTGNPATDPNMQGGQGADNGPKGQDGNSGSKAPMGDNKGPTLVSYGANGQRMG